ncbi:hypothetical protein M758_2G017500 [Ceratodon purpureus]|nr:hypothetical protein M758_2G017500 [Ceratodon purpureus]
MVDVYQLLFGLPSSHFGGCAQPKLTKSNGHPMMTCPRASVSWWSISTIARINSSYFECFSPCNLDCPAASSYFIKYAIECRNWFRVITSVSLSFAIIEQKHH